MCMSSYRINSPLGASLKLCQTVPKRQRKICHARGTELAAAEGELDQQLSSVLYCSLWCYAELMKSLYFCCPNSQSFFKNSVKLFFVLVNILHREEVLILAEQEMHWKIAPSRIKIYKGCYPSLGGDGRCKVTCCFLERTHLLPSFGGGSHALPAAEAVVAELTSAVWLARGQLGLVWISTPCHPFIFVVHIHKIIRLKEENGHGDRECIKRADDAK